MDEDVAFEAEEEHGEAAGKFAKLRAELASCRKEKQEYMDGWQRAKADYVNALKRFEEEKKQEKTRGTLKAVETLLPAFDALERAKQHGEVPAGFASIAKQLEGAFASLGLEAVGEVGEEFDPALHEALGTEEATASAEDNTVSAVLEKGWRMGGVLVRPAKVRVARAS